MEFTDYTPLAKSTKSDFFLQFFAFLKAISREISQFFFITAKMFYFMDKINTPLMDNILLYALF